MIGKNFKTFQTFSSTKIIVENIACLELFLMSFSKYPISNVWKWLNGKKNPEKFINLGQQTGGLVRNDPCLVLLHRILSFLLEAKN